MLTCRRRFSPSSSPGGRLVIPVGPVAAVQELQLIEKDSAGRTQTTRVAPVQFVPLVRPR